MNPETLILNTQLTEHPESMILPCPMGGYAVPNSKLRLDALL
ncbi:MAG TPA: hypothetical protein PK439_08325 [Nitrosomonas sp.]|nr:hypothetical protein [Nitrosomonas sp.]HRB78428.1 hypothetical protein [Nitrosomonas sp.]